MTICVRAVAVNPVDAIPGLAYRLIMPWLTFPAIMGGDVAGGVVEAGPGVTRLQPGDRVLGMADGLERSRNNAAEAPSRRTPSSCRTWSRPSPTSCPSNKPPCCPSRSRPRRPACSSETTSRCPSRPSTRPTASRRYWYGAARPTSVATASSSPAAPDTASSPRHPRATSGYVRSLGAAAAIDYHRRTAVDEIINSLDDSPLAGTLAIGSGSLQAALSIASQVPAGNLRRLPARRARLRGIPGRARRTRCWGRPRTDPQGPRPASHGSLREQARRPRVTRRPRPPDDPVQLRGY